MAKSKENTDEADLKEIRDRFSEAFTKWDPIYKDGDINMRFVAGDGWDPGDKKAREDNGRPVSWFDEIGQYLNQAVNEVRANPRAPKFSPEGDGANDDTARFYGSLMRKTDYDSNAQEAYTCAYENSLQRNTGFVRLRLEYEHARSHQQRVRIEAVPNPSCVYPDPDATRPDGSDWKYLFFIESYTKAEFQRSFPEAEFATFSTEQIAAVGSAWLSESRVQVAEYWCVEEEDADLVEVMIPPTARNPEPQYVSYIEGVDKKPRGGVFVQKRPTTIRKVYSCLTNGLEILAKDGEKWHLHPSEDIPFASCYGKIVWMNKGGGPERVILAMTTLARAPQMAYVFAACNSLEAMGTITKNPYMAYRGQLTATQKNAIARSLHEPVAVLEVEPTLPGLPNTLIPHPVRNPMAVDLSTYSIERENARRAIQAAMGWTPLPTQAQRKNEKSGVALKQIEESGQKGAYHFIDHYNDLLRRVGVLFEGIVDKIYDAERELTTIGADKSTEQWLINPGKDRLRALQGQKPNKSLNVLPSTKGRHSVTVDVGPEFDSERDESNAALDGLIGSPVIGMLEPAKRDKLISLSIRQRVLGPIGEKMADVISPPEKEGEEQMVPAAKVQELIAAGNAVQQELDKKVKELQAKLDAKIVEAEGKLVVQTKADETKLKIAEMTTNQKADDTDVDARTAMAIAELRAEIEMMKMQHAKEVKGAELEQSTHMAERDHQESGAEAEKTRQHASAEGDKGRQATADENERARQATAEQSDADRKLAEKTAKAKTKGDK